MTELELHSVFLEMHARKPPWFSNGQMVARDLQSLCPYDDSSSDAWTGAHREKNKIRDSPARVSLSGSTEHSYDGGNEVGSEMKDVLQSRFVHCSTAAPALRSPKW